MMTSRQRLKVTSKPALLTMQMKMKTTMIQPYQMARILEAETRSCPSSPKTNKWRYLN